MPRKERDEKRRDNKGRLLKSGESQRSDGRYAYKYIDTFGETQFVYSWKLVPTDKVPAGKRPCLSLREKIKQIQKDLDDGIDTGSCSKGVLRCFFAMQRIFIIISLRANRSVPSAESPLKRTIRSRRISSFRERKRAALLTGVHKIVWNRFLQEPSIFSGIRSKSM